jgi:hypothetical protein
MIRKRVTRFPESDHALAFLVSEDNFSIMQRTLLLQFTLVD